MTRVLLADDDADIRDLISIKLSALGYEVTAVASGGAALHAAAALRPDIAVLDVMMPGMTGIDVCRALRGRADTAAVPVLLLTAKVQEADVERGLAAGADDYVTKPFSPRELAGRIQAMLGDP